MTGIKQITGAAMALLLCLCVLIVPVSAESTEIKVVVPQSHNVVIIIENLPDEIITPEDADKVADAVNEYDDLTDEEKDQIPDDVKEKLEKAKDEAGEVNHTDGDVIITGGNLPWNVRVIVTPISENDPRWKPFFDKLTDKKLLYLYDIKLINTLTGKEYVIPEGETVMVEISGADLADGEKIMVAHEKKDGTIEYLTATVKNGKLTFTASSFSLYGVAAAADKAADPVPETGDNSNPVFWLLLSGGALLLLAAMSAAGRKKKRNI